MIWIMRLGAVLLAAAAILVGAILLLPGPRIARIAADEIGALTGREVTIAGDARISLYPVLGISTGRITLGNADWSGAGPMLRAERFMVGVDPIALLRGDIRITGLEAEAPEILLERAADGRVNWHFGRAGATGPATPDVQGATDAAPADDPPPAPRTPARRRTVTLDRAVLTGATVRYVDHGRGEETVLADTDLDLRWPDSDGAAEIDAVLRPAGRDLQLSGRLGTVAGFLAGDLSEMALTLRAPEGRISFEGRGSTQPALAGLLQAELGDTAGFLAALGISGVEIPEGLGREVEARGEITVAGATQVALRRGDLRLDDNRLSVEADLDLAAVRPVLRAQLRADALDLSGKGADAAPARPGPVPAAGDTPEGAATIEPPAGGAVSDGWPTAALDLSALGLLDGEVALVAGRLAVGGFRFADTRIAARIDRGRAVLRLQELAGYGGKLVGELVVNARNGVSVSADLAARDIDMKALLTDAAGINRFSGNGTAKLKVLGAGPSVDAIMKSLRGDAAIDAGAGHIAGVDLDRLMRGGDGTGGTTVFDSLSAGFAISDGDMHNTDLLMRLPRARVTGEGRIGLGARDLDYLLTPTLLEGETSRGLAIPVRIRGPWHAPRIRPDLEKAIDLNLRDEKRALKEKMRGKIDRRLERELGVTREEGESVEDALRRTLEDEAARGLRKLFE